MERKVSATILQSLNDREGKFCDKCVHLDTTQEPGIVRPPWCRILGVKLGRDSGNKPLRDYVCVGKPKLQTKEGK